MKKKILKSIIQSDKEANIGLLKGNSPSTAMHDILCDRPHKSCHSKILYGGLLKARFTTAPNMSHGQTISILLNRTSSEQLC